MKLKFIILVVSFILIPLLISANPQKELVIEEVIRSEERFRKRVLFLYDRSGSMNSDKLGRAFNYFKMIIEQPVDEMEIAVISFNHNFNRWPGIPEPNVTPPVPKGWAAMPSIIAIDKATKWLEVQGSAGGTEILPALRSAFNENRTEISIIIVSDGEFYDDTPVEEPGDFDLDIDNLRVNYVIDVVTNLQNDRVKRGLDKIQINAYGIGDKTMDILSALTKVGFGNYYKEYYKQDEDED